MELPAHTHFLRIAQNLEATLRSIQDMQKAHPLITPDRYIKELEGMLQQCHEKAEKYKGDKKEYKRSYLGDSPHVSTDS